MSLTKTAIPYLTHSWPIVTGCLPDRPCWRRCWARGIAHRFHRDFTPTFHPERLEDLYTRREPRLSRAPQVVGVAFTGDLFALPTQDAPRIAELAATFGMMAVRPDLTFVVLTKRPEVMAEFLGFVGRDDPDGPWSRCVVAAGDMIPEDPPHRYAEESIGPLDGPWPLPNVHLGFSAWDQASFDAGWRALAPLAAAGWRVWCSLEPMVGAVDVSGAMPVEEQGYGAFHGGDPRDFSPDPECSTEKERDAHRAACAAWDRGERPGFPVSGLEVSSKDETYTDKRTGKTHTIPAGTAALVERSSFGLGVYTMRDPGLSGVILGAESGPGARPLDLAWVRAVRDDCAAAGVPFAFKQTVKGGECRDVTWLGKPARVPVLDGAVHLDLAWAPNTEGGR